MKSQIFWGILLATIAGEFLLPALLGRRVPGYDSRRMVMSVLGNPKSPVRKIYNLWLVWLGGFLSLAAVLFFLSVRPVSFPLAVLTLLSILTFAVGAGLLSGIFSVNEEKNLSTAASRIHGIGAAIGFMALLFFPLLDALAAFRQGKALIGWMDAVSFVLALGLFTLFVLADKESFRGTAVSCEGLWQRLSLAAMYIPFLIRIIEGFFQSFGR